MITHTLIIVNLQIEGIHYWKDAAEKLPEVAYLSNPHRHIFHITAKKEVTHDDRDVEIIMFKREIEKYLKEEFWNHSLELVDFRSKSCEWIAADLLKQFNLFYCSVLEDNENGAEVIQ